MTHIQLTFPFPPTVNHYLKRGRWGNYLSDKAKIFRAEVEQEVFETGCNLKLTSKLEVDVILFPPDDLKNRDLDNHIKALFDAMEHAGVFVNDYQIDSFSVARGPVCEKGKVLVDVKEI